MPKRKQPESSTSTTDDGSKVVDLTSETMTKKPKIKSVVKPKGQKGKDAAITDRVLSLPPRPLPEPGQHLPGAHISSSGGGAAIVEAALDLGLDSFALFIGSPRNMSHNVIDPSTSDAFKAACKRHNYRPEHMLPHARYFINLGNPDKEKLQKSRALLIHEMKLCVQMGLVLYNIHPGSTVGAISTDAGCKLIAEGINIAHKEVPDVVIVLENTAGGGNTIGRSLEELQKIIKDVVDKERVGVCIDTCHAFASGYDMRTADGFSGFLDKFDRIVGLKYLKAMHLNDSKGDLASKTDRHEKLGDGNIGGILFEAIMKEPRVSDIPLILETPGDYVEDLKLLRGLKKAKPPKPKGILAFFSPSGSGSGDKGKKKSK